MLEEPENWQTSAQSFQYQRYNYIFFFLLTFTSMVDDDNILMPLRAMRRMARDWRAWRAWAFDRKRQIGRNKFLIFCQTLHARRMFSMLRISFENLLDEFANVVSLIRTTSCLFVRHMLLIHFNQFENTNLYIHAYFIYITVCIYL